MKRHISIFALLLCAFAAVGSVAAANKLLLPQNVLLEDSPVVCNTLIVPKGSWTSLSSGSRVYESILSNGLKVVKWEYAANQFATSWTDLGQSGTNITWTYRSDMSNVYLRPWLKWLLYSLSYNANGGSGSMSGQSDVRYDTKVSLPACGFTKEGYSFAGWSLTAKAGGAVWSAGTKCDGHDFGVDAQNHDYGKDAKGTPVTLYAQWTPNQYTVTFDANCTGGSSDPASKPVTYDSTYGDLPSPTRPGKNGRTQDESWQFDGWYNSSSNKVDSTTKVSITDDVSLYAHWTEKFEVKYVDAAQFGGTVLKTEYVLSGGTAVSPNTPEKEGYTFVEWTGYNDFSNVRQDRKYTAVYTGNKYTVVFHSGFSDETHRQDFTYGESKALSPNTFVNAGHSFLGWAETNDLGRVKYEDKASVTDMATRGEVHLYAVWDANAYQIVFDGNGGSGEMAPIDMRYGVATNLPHSAFVYVGLDFKSWRDELNKTNYLAGATVSNLTTEAGGTVTLKAVWFEGYFVEFYGGKGASGEMSRQQFACGVDTALPLNEFTKKGYTFTHWTNTQGNVFLDGAVVKDLATMGETAALHAVWTPNKYYVKFDDNGANDGDMPVQEFTYDQMQKLVPNAYVRDFHNFVGWGLTREMEDLEYFDQDQVRNLTSVANATNVLYALWDLNLTPLSKAADSLNLAIENGIGKMEGSEGLEFSDWTVVSDCSYKGDESCCGVGGQGVPAAMNAIMPSSGTLRFKVKVSENPIGWFALYKNVYQNDSRIIRVRETGESWQECEVVLEKGDKIAWVSVGDKTVCWVDAVVWEPDGVTLRFDANGGTDAPADLKIPLGSRDKLPREVPTRSGYAFRGWRLGSDTENLYQPRETYTAGSEIATITFTAVWEPTGEHPVPEDGEDNVTISSAAVSDGKFTLSFKSDERFDYNLLTNGNLLIKSWGIMETLVGDGKVLTFEPEIIKGQPQLFYKVETIQKK